MIGSCLAPEFAEDSRRVLSLVQSGHLLALISSMVVAELKGAPEVVRHVLTSLPAHAVNVVDLTEEVLQLRDAYIEGGVVGRSSLGDATHVVAATIARADAILSWNFRHIARLDRIKQYNQVNLSNGYGILTILSPREVGVEDG